MKTNAVAAYAVGLVPIESMILAMLKQKHNPTDDTISSARRPNLSTVHSGMNEAARYVSDVHPPRISERFRERPIVLAYTTGA
jgi:hypothetical protein